MVEVCDLTYAWKEYAGTGIFSLPVSEAWYAIDAHHGLK